MVKVNKRIIEGLLGRVVILRPLFNMGVIVFGVLYSVWTRCDRTRLVFQKVYI